MIPVPRVLCFEFHMTKHEHPLRVVHSCMYLWCPMPDWQRTPLCVTPPCRTLSGMIVMAASPAELAATCELLWQRIVHRWSTPWSLICWRCDCQPFTCMKRHASCHYLHMRFCSATARRLPKEILASSLTPVGLRSFPSTSQWGSGILPSTVGQRRRRVVPCEKLTFISAALRTSSTRAKLRRAFDLSGSERMRDGRARLTVFGFD